MKQAKWLVLGTAVVLTTGLQAFRVSGWLRAIDPVVTPGLDFRTVIWGPVRGLAAGLNPYARPADPDYLSSTGVVGPSPPRPPSLLLLEGWLAVMPLRTAFVLSVVLSCLLLWAGFLLMAQPRSLRQSVVAAALGCAVVLGGHADFLLGLGQTTAWAVLGLGMLMRWRAGLLGGFGLSLVLTLPHAGFVLSLMLLVLGLRNLVAWGWSVMLVMSLPGAVLAVQAAGGLGEVAESLGAGVSALSGADNELNRGDVGGVLASSGPLAVFVPLVVVSVYLLFLYRFRPELDEVLLLSMVSTIAVAVYHMPYHMPLLLAVAAAASLATKTPRTVAVPAWVVLSAGVASSFSILWELDADAGSGTRALWLVFRYAFLFAPLVFAVTSTAECARRARTRSSVAAVSTAPSV